MGPRLRNWLTGAPGGADEMALAHIRAEQSHALTHSTPLMMVLSVCAACVLLRWGQNGPRAKHTLALMLSAAALLCWLLLGILSLWQVSSAAGAAVLSWKC